jgi:predicted nucleotidyltransferase
MNDQQYAARAPAHGRSPGCLAEVLPSAAFARLLLHFALHGEQPQHVRELQRRTGLGASSLLHELQRLERRGLVERRAAGRRVEYRVVHDHPGWGALRGVIREFADPAEVVAGAIAPMEGVEAAFVFGSFARDDFRDDSDVDVLVVSSTPEASLGREVAEASLLLGRPVEIRRYTPEKLKRQIEGGNAVLRRIIAGPKRWIVGDETRLMDVAA